MKEYHPEEVIKSKPVLEALTVAHEYCLFFESVEKYTTKDILNYFQKITPLLYLKASTVPETEVTDESFNERFVTEEQWEKVFKSLREKFGDDDTYFVLDHNNDTAEASLSDNMADIYQDMKDFVMLYQKGSMYAQESAISQFKILMASRWGPIAIDALKACHVKLYGDITDQTDPENEYPWLF